MKKPKEIRVQFYRSVVVDKFYDVVIEVDDDFDPEDVNMTWFASDFINLNNIEPESVEEVDAMEEWAEDWEYV